MKVPLWVLEDEDPVQLFFVDQEHADRFILFMKMFIQEVAPRKGYGAYIPHPGPQSMNGQPHLRGALLQYELIRDMAREVRRARLAAQYAEEEPPYMPDFSIKEGVMRFEFDPSKLPPRLMPEPGDLARIVDHPDYDRKIGRMQKATERGTVILAPTRCGIKEEVELEARHVMKIFDFVTFYKVA